MELHEKHLEEAVKREKKFCEGNVWTTVWLPVL